MSEPSYPSDDLALSDVLRVRKNMQHEHIQHNIITPIIIQIKVCIPNHFFAYHFVVGGVAGGAVAGGAALGAPGDPGAPGELGEPGAPGVPRGAN